MATATHAETSPNAETLIVTPLSCSLVGQADRVLVMPGSRAATLYGTRAVEEDFFCNYGLNPEYSSPLEAAGLRITGVDALLLSDAVSAGRGSSARRWIRRGSSLKLRVAAGTRLALLDGACRDRTGDLRLAKAALSQLS